MDTIKQNEPLTPYTLTLIRHKARKLAGSAGFTLDDIEDIQQDLIRDLLERMPKFDPTKASLHTFADRVVGRRLCNLLRHRQSAMRNPNREAFSFNEEVETEEGPMQRQEMIGQDEVDLRTERYSRTAAERAHLQMDIESVLAGLSPELRHVADLLRTRSVSEVARALGIPRCTFRDKHLAQLRQVFAAYRMDDYLG